MDRINNLNSVFSDVYQDSTLERLAKRKSGKAVDAEIEKIDRVIKAQEKFGGKVEELEGYRGRLIELKDGSGGKAEEVSVSIKPMTERDQLKSDLFQLEQQRERAQEKAVRLRDDGGLKFREANNQVLNFDRKILDIKLALSSIDIREEVKPDVKTRTDEAFKKAAAPKDPIKLLAIKKEELAKIKQTMAQINRATDMKLDRLALLEAINREMKAADDESLPSEERQIHKTLLNEKLQQYGAMEDDQGAHISFSSEGDLVMLMGREMSDLNDLNGAHNALSPKADALEREIEELESAPKPEEKASIISRGWKMVSGAVGGLFSRVGRIFNRTAAPKLSQLEKFKMLLGSLTGEDLKEEGIFRKQGQDMRTREVLDAFSKTGQLKYKDDDSVHTKAVAIKRFLRNQVKLKPKERALQDLKAAFFEGRTLDAINMLNDEQAEIVREMIDLCRRIAAESDSNLMDAKNLGVVFGPNLAEMLQIPIEEIADGLQCNEVITNMIKSNVNIRKEDGLS